MSLVPNFDAFEGDVRKEINKLRKRKRVIPKDVEDDVVSTVYLEIPPPKWSYIPFDEIFESNVST